MNEKQRHILVATASVICLMILFPPFHVNVKGVTENLGYRFILTPPRGEIYAGLHGSIDVLTLLIQILGVTIAGSLLSFAFKNKS